MTMSWSTTRLASSRSPASNACVASAMASPTSANIVRVFALVGEAMAEATHALLAGDRELAKRVVDQDIVIDNLVNELVATAEARLLDSANKSVETRRTLLTLLRILPEVERNGDLAEHIARRAARGLGSEMSPRSRGLVERMGEVAATI